MSSPFRAKDKLKSSTNESKKQVSWRWMCRSCKANWTNEKECISKIEIWLLKIVPNNLQLNSWRKKWPTSKLKTKNCNKTNKLWFSKGPLNQLRSAKIPQHKEERRHILLMMSGNHRQENQRSFLKKLQAKLKLEKRLVQILGCHDKAAVWKNLEALII